MRLLLSGVALALVMATPGYGAPAATLHVGQAVPVTIRGYHGDAMEPFLSADGKYLFFNNRNDAGTDTNLYFARRVDDTTFSYGGAIAGANSPALDAVASMDATDHFYFVSTRSYARTLATIYRGTFRNGRITDVSIVPGVSKAAPGWVDFDADVSPGGSTLYFADGHYGPAGQLLAADLVIATKTPTGFSRLPDSARILATVNTSALEYGAAISNDGLTLYFTRAPAPIGSGPPAIYVTNRRSPSSAFGPPTKLAGLTGFVEAPALAPDGHAIYFHELVGGKYVIYRASTT